MRETGRQDLIRLVYQSANLGEGEFEVASAGKVLAFKRKLVLSDVLVTVECCSVPQAVYSQQSGVGADM